MTNLKSQPILYILFNNDMTDLTGVLTTGRVTGAQHVVGDLTGIPVFAVADSVVNDGNRDLLKLGVIHSG